jgi:hypothetical protein
LHADASKQPHRVQFFLFSFGASVNGRLSAIHDRPLADTRSEAQAIADVPFGDSNPSGKLPITFAQ